MLICLLILTLLGQRQLPFDPTTVATVAHDRGSIPAPDSRTSSLFAAHLPARSQADDTRTHTTSVRTDDLTHAPMYVSLPDPRAIDTGLVATTAHHTPQKLMIADPRAIDTGLVATASISATVLHPTLLDAATGQPLPSLPGSVSIHAHYTQLAQVAFTTDDHGDATISLPYISEQPVDVVVTTDDYLSWSVSNVTLHDDTTDLTARLVRAPVLVNTLVDDSAGTPLANRVGYLRVYSDTTQVTYHRFTTDANGTFTVRFDTLLGPYVRLAYEMQGYAYQFSDRAATLADATPIALPSGQTTLTTRLVAASTLVATLRNAITNQPVARAFGQVEVYSGTHILDSVWFTTDATGVYTATFRALLPDSVLLRHTHLDGYAYQFYDRQPTAEQATPVSLPGGTHPLSVSLLPAARLITTLLDNATGQPLRSTSGRLAVWVGDQEREVQSFTTDTSGVFTQTLQSLPTQGVQLEYRSVHGYARQFYDRQTARDHAATVTLTVGDTVFTTRLLAAPVLQNTLLDDRSSAPLAHASGVFVIFADGIPVESDAFTTDGNGVFSAPLSNVLIGQAVQVEYSMLNGYARQFYDRAPTLDRAAFVTIAAPMTPLVTRLLPATELSGTLRDAATGHVLPNASGSMDVYIGDQSLEQQSFTSDATGAYRVQFVGAYSGTITLGFAISGYPYQFYDRATERATATPVSVHAGETVVDLHLIATRLVGTLRDDLSGQPIAATAGTLTIFNGTGVLDTLDFTSDTSGVYTATLHSLVTQRVSLQFAVTGYAAQVYDRALTQDAATPVDLQLGNTVVNPHLVVTRVVNTLRDDLTDQPVASAHGLLGIYDGSTRIDQVPIATDANGVYTATLHVLVNRAVHLDYRVDGYAPQFYERHATLDQADTIALQIGVTQFTTHLVPAFSLVNTLTDSITNQPLVYVAGTMTAFSGTVQLQHWSFTTDASGVYTVTFATFLTSPVHLKYEVDGYPVQYYDRALVQNEAASVTLAPGMTTLISRLLPPATLSHTLLDIGTGLPIANTHGWMHTVGDTFAPEYHAFTTDASGVYTVTLTATPLNLPLYLFEEVPGYFDQYHDGAFTRADATPVTLHSGPNTLTSHLIPPTTIVNRLVDADTGAPLRNMQIKALVSTSNEFWGFAFTTDANGVFTYDRLGGVADDNYTIFYMIDGYPYQFYDGTSNFARAKRIALHHGRNTLETHIAPYPTLRNTLIDDATGQPVRNIAVNVRIIADDPIWPLLKGTFSTDDHGTMVIQFGEFANIANDDIQIEYTVAGYPTQFYDRKATLEQADPLFLKGGSNNTLITRLTKAFAATATPTASLTATLTATASASATPPASATVDSTTTPRVSPPPDITSTSPPATSASETPYVALSPTPAGAENGLLLRPETGGTLVARSAAITVTAFFPVGAVNQPVTARIRWLTQPASADDGHGVDAPFVVEAFTETGDEVVQLNRPLTLTVDYSPASLQGADETSIVFVAWDATLHQWIHIPAHLNTQQHTISVAVDRLSRFALQLQERSLIYLSSIVR